MPKRSSKKPSKKRKRKDINQMAAAIVTRATKNPHAVALGRLGGVKGGPARKAALTPDRRSEIASKAARVRWKTGHGSSLNP
jgi:hypothetical protein